MTVITAGGLSALILELVKWVLRKFVLKDEMFDFPGTFYLVAVPVLNVLVIPLLAFLEIPGAEMPTDWVGFFRVAVQVLIGSLISVWGYTNGIKPLKAKIRGTA